MSKLIVREIEANDIMSGMHVEMTANARILGGQTRYGNVYLFVEEEVMRWRPKGPEDLPLRVKRYFKGFRAGRTNVGAGVDLKDPVYRCSILEADRDHCHVYEGEAL